MNQESLVSVIFVSYQQAGYVESALKSILLQDYPDLEILVFDDFSQDGTRVLIANLVEEYEGPHQILVDETDRNRGLVPNLNRAFSKCRGRLVVLAAGDDVSRPDRVSVLVDLWKRNQYPAALFSDVELIDEEGRKIERDYGYFREQLSYFPDGRSMAFAEELTERMREGEFLGVPGCAAAYSIDLYQRFGELSPELLYEDRALGFRASLIGGIAMTKEKLMQYRMMDNSLSARSTSATAGLRSLSRKLINFRKSSSRFRVAYEQMKADLETARTNDWISEDLANDLDRAIEEKISEYRDGEQWWSYSMMGRLKALNNGPFKRPVTKWFGLLPLHLICRES